MKKLCSIVLFFVLAFIAVIPLGGCSVFEDEPKDNFPELTINQNVDIELLHLKITPTWKYSKSSDGYYGTITLKVVVNGYSELTYYDAEVRVIFTATLITDNAPSGMTFSKTVTCRLDNKGNGEETITADPIGCRAINSKATSKLVSGSVTKIV